MKYLENQEMFEILLGKGESDTLLPPLTVIWFSAEWCGPCKKINIQKLIDTFPANWLKCDVDRNDYTAGYCGIRSIPSFLVIYNKKVIGTKTSSSTLEILQWLQSLTY